MGATASFGAMDGALGTMGVVGDAGMGALAVTMLASGRISTGRTDGGT